MLGNASEKVKTVLVHAEDKCVFVTSPKEHIVFRRVEPDWFEFMGFAIGILHLNEWVEVDRLLPYIVALDYPRNAPYQYGSSMSPPDVHQLSSPTANFEGSHVPE